MTTFTQKLQLLYGKLFHNNMDRFTEALIDYQKFNPDKFDTKDKVEAKKQFFFHRKTVLRRWLHKGSRCSLDFKKSYPHYPLSTYRLNDRSLFVLEDFTNEDNLAWFDERIERFLQYQKRAEMKSAYRYLYLFCPMQGAIVDYEIVAWYRGERNETQLTLQQGDETYGGSFLLTEESNILITIERDLAIRYLLFHEDNDLSRAYIVGVGMGYLPNDNKVPRAQKVVFSKSRLTLEEQEMLFVLNETEVVEAVENRFSLNRNPLVHYFNRFKQYVAFFGRLRQGIYRDHFYYRLAFLEFYSITELFGKVAKEESYYVFDYQRALLELLKTVERIGDMSLQMVIDFDPSSHLLMNVTKRDLEIKSKLFALAKQHNVATTMIFVLDHQPLPSSVTYLWQELVRHGIEVRTVAKHEIIQEVNSVDFLFIHLDDPRDFVLADPLRDSKEVYKLFCNELTMDEYRSDYQKILNQSDCYVTT